MPKLRFRASNLLAIAIAVAMTVWLGSGLLFNEKEVSLTIAERNVAFEAASRDAGPTSVRTLISTARETSPVVTLRGFTRNKRSVMVRTETDGRVEARPVERGEKVSEGDLLCELAVEDRQVRLEEAIATRARAQLDYDGAVELHQRGLISDVDLANRTEHLARAWATETSSRIALERTQVRAPFAGIVEETAAEVGDFLKRGDVCATMLDFDPMLVVGRVSEFEVSSLAIGDEATAELISGDIITGHISFLGRDSRDGTRTYRVEVQVPNPNQSFRSGVTAEINVPLSPILAHRITPNLLRLDDIGRLGVYTVSSDNRAEFHSIEILRDDETGFFVTGLPKIAQLVVRGQGTLVPGQAVKPEDVSALSARGDVLTLEEASASTSASLVETPAG